MSIDLPKDESCFRINSLLPFKKLIFVSLLIILLAACSIPTPPTEFAPDGDTVQKAILLKLRQTEERLSNYLMASSPVLEITQVNVKKLEPVFIADLSAYHLQGTYNLILKLPRQQVNQQNNRFDIYLQRQIEGKTWRLLRREPNQSYAGDTWKSYLIQ